MDHSDDNYIGRVAYESAVRAIGGDLLPAWSALPEDLRSQWQTVGRETRDFARENAEDEADEAQPEDAPELVATDEDGKPLEVKADAAHADAGS